MTSVIAYLRVSTARQGESGLGLDAQRSIVEGFARSNGATIVESFVEVESGKLAERPQLAAALARCKATGATLVVARLDRLARDLVFVATMLRDGVDFVACDAPYANRLTLGILAAVAEDEGRRISDRTRAALAAAKARGVRLGGYRGVPPTKAAAEKGRAVRASIARQRAHEIAPAIAAAKAAGAHGPSAIAKALNAQGVVTHAGGQWHATSVARVLSRIAC